MKFFTHIDIPPLKQQIDYTSRILSLGSCFANNIAHKLSDAKFRVLSSPTGILFNPESIASAINRIATNEGIKDTELQHDAEVWFSYDFHSSFSATNREQALTSMQEAMACATSFWQEVDTVIITFGTAWIYRHCESGKVVANCHKQPQKLFRRELLSVEDIVKSWSPILSNHLRDKHVIFTVSPIRHLSDGLEQNSLSKAILRIGINELLKLHANASYFPSFEIMNDELRDYRFYGEDMVHPSDTAIEYIWQRFADAAIDEKAHEVMLKIDKIRQAAHHRPFNPQSEAYKGFCLAQLQLIEQLQSQYTWLDFAKEKTHFCTHL